MFNARKMPWTIQVGMTFIELNVETFDGIFFGGFEAIGALAFANPHGNIAKTMPIGSNTICIVETIRVSYQKENKNYNSG